MATLWIGEASRLVQLPGVSGQILPLPLDLEQTVAIGGASAQSAPFGAGTLGANINSLMLVRVNCDVACSIAVGANPVATIASTRLAPNQTEYFGVYPGQRLAVIANP